MIPTPQILMTEIRPTIVIRAKIPLRDVGGTWILTMNEVMSACYGGRAWPGPLFVRHLSFPTGHWDVEMGMLVDPPGPIEAPVERSTLPAVKAARTVFTGPFEDIPLAWGEFLNWIEVQGLRSGPEIWQIFLHEPEAPLHDENTRQTELICPLA